MIGTLEEAYELAVRLRTKLDDALGLAEEKHGYGSGRAKWIADHHADADELCASISNTIEAVKGP